MHSYSFAMFGMEFMGNSEEYHPYKGLDSPWKPLGDVVGHKMEMFDFSDLQHSLALMIIQASDMDWHSYLMFYAHRFNWAPIGVYFVCGFFIILNLIMVFIALNLVTVVILDNHQFFREAMKANTKTANVQEILEDKFQKISDRLFPLKYEVIVTPHMHYRNSGDAPFSEFLDIYYWNH